MATKRQQTMAKVARERLVKERRALKLEKKQAARDAKAAGETTSPDTVDENGEVDAPEASSLDRETT
ncbi:MAG: hypothetical protein M3321_05140 [Actinomycetota bacterium]|nr:hypothetical protein [Actinomycetota bacterium]